MAPFTIFPVPARELYEIAGIVRSFSKWMKDRICSLRLEEENDYVVDIEHSFHNGCQMLYYFLNLEPAIEIAEHMRDKGKRDRALDFISIYDTPVNRSGRAFIQAMVGRRPFF